MTQFIWVFIFSSNFVQNSSEVGCLALGFSGIRRAGFPKTKWSPLFSPLCTLSEPSQNCKHTTDCFVSSFYQTPLKNFLLPSPEGVRNFSLGHDFTESRARWNRPNCTGLVYVYVFTDIYKTRTQPHCL